MTKKILSVSIAALVLAGCTETSPLRASVEAEITNVEAPKSYLSDRRRAIQPHTILAADPIRLMPIADLEQKPLPETLVGPIDFTDVDAAFALRALAWEAGIPVKFDDGVGSEVVTFATSRQISLDDAVKIITENAGLDYTYDGKFLEIRRGGLYMVSLPSVAEATSSLTDVITALGGEIISTDDRSSRLTIQADKRVASRIQGFLDNAGASSDLIIFDAWLYEVALNDSNTLGIDWSAAVTGLLDSQLEVEITTPTASATDPFVGAISFGGDDFDLGAVVGFLSEQGAVKSVSSPTLSMTSGGEATFSISQNQIYVRNIRQVSDSGDTANPTVETETEELNTGIDVTTSATFASGIVFADFDMSVSEFLKFEEFPSGDTTLKLPVTTQRDLNTSVQARPGDVIIMGGMISERNSVSDSGLPVGDIKTRRSGESDRSELVVLLRPRVISFRPAN